MTKLRVSEIYVSIQGEGPRTGQQTIFLRFAGCNLRCPGWPCDSPHAIFPDKYRDEWRSVSVEDLVEELAVIDKGRHLNICMTGGEPFLQPHELLKSLVERTYEAHVIEVFTNGTIEYPEWAFEYLYFVMDWKLPGSGENPNDPVRLVNLKRLQPGDAVKFVCTGRADFVEAFKLWAGHIKDGNRELIVYAGVAWGKMDPKDLVQWMLDDSVPWRLNLQQHQYIWPPNERAR